VERFTNSRNYNPMAAKWPAVANGPVEYHKQAAMQARFLFQVLPSISSGQ